MSVEKKPTTKRGTRSGAAPTADRVPEKHEESRHPTIAELAYQLYEERGRQEGHQLRDWIEAERRISDKQESGEKVHV